jgi:enoyl-CoA hydratase
MPDTDGPAAPVLTERLGDVLLITLNRPEVRNAVNTPLALGVAGALDVLDGDDDLRAAVITGAGKGFCAGADLRAVQQGDRAAHPVRGFAGIVRRPPVKPIIAAVEGFAVAGGMEIALACDLVVASRGARFGLPEVKRSLVASAGGLLRLPDRVPRALAVELALTGETVTAERMHEAGALARLTEPGGAVEAALELAALITVNAPLSLVATKRILDERDDWSRADRWDRQDEIVGDIATSEDAREGALAFTEHRDPVWKGR